VASYERKQEVLREENKSLRLTILTIRRTIAQAIPDSKVPLNATQLDPPLTSATDKTKRRTKEEGSVSRGLVVDNLCKSSYTSYSRFPDLGIGARDLFVQRSAS
jgi:hypothetical protein